MRKFLVLALIGFSFWALSSQAALAAAAPPPPPLLGQACSNIGETKIDNDHKNIIACLCATTANCGASDMKWKAMSDTLTGCAANQVMTMKNGQASCVNGYGGSYMMSIAGTPMDGQIASMPHTLKDCFMKNPLTGTCSCPTGFTAQVVDAFDNRGECKYYNSPGSCGMYIFGCF